MIAILKTRWIPIGVLFIALIAILAVLYVKNKAPDDSEYFESLALLRQLRQMDAQWELDALRAKNGSDSPPEAWADPLVAFRELSERAARMTRGSDPGGAKTAAEALGKAIREKAELVNQLKLHYATLRKSLALLPSASDAAQRQVGNAAAFKNVDRTHMRNIAEDVNRVLAQTIVYSQTPSRERAAAIQSDLAKLAGARPALPSEAVEALDGFIGHAKTVVREQIATAELLTGIAAVPTAAPLDEMNKALSEWHRAAVAGQSKPSRYFVGVSLLLLLLFGYAAFHAASSYTRINNLNRALADANGGLRQKISEHTQAGQPQVPQSPPAPAAQATQSAQTSAVDRRVGGVVAQINARIGHLKGNLEVVASRMGDIANLQDLCRSAAEILSARGAQTTDLQSRLRQVYDVASKISEAKFGAELADRVNDSLRGVNHVAEIFRALPTKQEAPIPVLTESQPVATAQTA